MAKTIKTIMTAAIVAGTAVATMAQADAAQMTRFKSGNWSGGAYSNDSTGRFSHCAASASYKSGILLLFSVDKNLKWKMGFAKSGWNLRRGDNYPVSYRIDRFRIYRGQAQAINNRLATVKLPGSRANVFNQMRRGRLLSVATKTDVLKFSLNGTSRMLSSLLRCAERYGRRSGGSNPFGGGSGGSNPFGASSQGSNPFDA